MSPTGSNPCAFSTAWPPSDMTNVAKRNGEAGYLTRNRWGSAAIAETDVGAVRQENTLDGAFAGNQQRGLCPAAVELLRFGLKSGAGAGSHRLGTGEHGPRIISAGVRAGSRSGETHRRIEQAVQHVGSREPNGGARDGAEAVAGEMDDRTLRMTDGEASRLLHVGGCKKIDIHSAFDLLTHEAGRPEFRRRDRVGAGRKTAYQIREGIREAAGADDLQSFGAPRGRKQNQSDKTAGDTVAHLFSTRDRNNRVKK
jgi:hypothetical protein